MSAKNTAVTPSPLPKKVQQSAQKNAGPPIKVYHVGGGQMTASGQAGPTVKAQTAANLGGSAVKHQTATSSTVKHQTATSHAGSVVKNHAALSHGSADTKQASASHGGSVIKNQALANQGGAIIKNQTAVIQGGSAVQRHATASPGGSAVQKPITTNNGGFAVGTQNAAGQAASASQQQTAAGLHGYTAPARLQQAAAHGRSVPAGQVQAADQRVQRSAAKTSSPSPSPPKTTSAPGSGMSNPGGSNATPAPRQPSERSQMPRPQEVTSPTPSIPKAAFREQTKRSIVQVAADTNLPAQKQARQTPTTQQTTPTSSASPGSANSQPEHPPQKPGHMSQADLLIRFRQAAALHGHNFDDMVAAAELPPMTPPNKTIARPSPPVSEVPQIEPYKGGDPKGYISKPRGTSTAKANKNMLSMVSDGNQRSLPLIRMMSPLALALAIVLGYSIYPCGLPSLSGLFEEASPLRPTLFDDDHQIDDLEKQIDDEIMLENAEEADLNAGIQASLMETDPTCGDENGDDITAGRTLTELPDTQEDIPHDDELLDGHPLEQCPETQEHVGGEMGCDSQCNNAQDSAQQDSALLKLVRSSMGAGRIHAEN